MDTISLTCGFCNKNYTKSHIEIPFICESCKCTVDLPVSKDSSLNLDTFFDELSSKELEETIALPEKEVKLSELKTSQKRYKKKKELASGGMGKILLVEDTHLGRDVVMKVLKNQSCGQTLGRRFVEEAKITSNLMHPNIIPIYDFDQRKDKSLFLTMKHVKGKNLSEIIQLIKQKKEKDFSQGKRLQVFLKICQAVSYAHSKKTLHRDLKPDNIMIGEFGEVIVLDWGIAKVKKTPHIAGTKEKIKGQGTQFGQIVGTPGYMAPEQAFGKIKEIDERSDVYGLGTILYELIYLQPVMEPETPVKMLMQYKIESELKKHDYFGNKISLDLYAIANKALSKQKELRYQTVSELEKDIECFLEDKPISARKYGIGEKILRASRSNINQTLGIASIVLFIAFLVFGNMAIELGKKREQYNQAKKLLGVAAIHFEKGKEFYQKKLKNRENRNLQQLQDKHWAIAIESSLRAKELYPQIPIDESMIEIFELRYKYNKKQVRSKRVFKLEKLKEQKELLREIIDCYDKNIVKIKIQVFRD